jgi:serine/threonine protein kinase
MSHEHKREVAIFDAVLQLPEEQRDAYLEQACGADMELLQRVRSLLNANERQTELLAPVSTSVVSPALSEKAGDTIGRYKLLQQIGEGGCGVVYMAEQEEPVRRRVALKIIKLGMDTKQVVARFEAERQALAMMDHPNIAKVLDAGATETGRPYFVMDLVRGVRITEYCDNNNLPTSKRLELFMQVCHAVQHAHQKGIIHRDLKPSNILVTMNDGVALVKVIDFGIAKAAHGRLTDKTLFTAFEQFIGTPAYMSPEQAEITSLDVDTRTDIYSLGVLLYELLTGKTPFEGRDLIRAGLDGMRRTIREKEPERPSTKLGAMAVEELTLTANRRRTDPPRLVSGVRGDLDWIVMKCLEKDRARRYETTNGLCLDIERHLSNEPVAARPPSKSYRFQRLVRRNKLAFAAVTAVLVSLLAGLGVSMWMFLREREVRRQAVTAEERALMGEKKAQTEGSKSQQIAGFLTQMLQVAGPSIALSSDTASLRKFLDGSVQRFSIQFTNEPEVEAELLVVAGTIYLKLGDIAKAQSVQRRALLLRKAVFGTTNAAVAGSLTELARALARYGGPDALREAEGILREAMPIWRKTRGTENEDVARAMALLAGVLSAEGKLTEAEDLWRQTLELRRRLLTDEHPDVAGAMGGLAMVQAKRGRLDEAEKGVREALEMEKRLMGSNCVDVATTLENLGGILRRRNNLPDAEIAYREAFMLTRKLFGADNLYTYRDQLALADVLRNEGKLEEAEASYRQLLTTVTNVFGELSPELPRVLVTLGYTLRNEHRLTEAQSSISEALAIRRKVLKSDDPLLASTICDLSDVLVQDHKLIEAEKMLREALATHEESQARDERPLASVLQRLVGVLREKKELPEARSVAEEAVASYDRHPEWPFAERDRAVHLLANVLQDLGDVDQLAVLRRNEAQRRLTRLRAEAETGNPGSLNSLAWMLATCSESCFRDAKGAVAYAELLTTRTGRTNSIYLDTLAAAYAEAGDFAKAAAVQREAMALVQKGEATKDYTSRLKLYESNTPYREPL